MQRRNHERPPFFAVRLAFMLVKRWATVPRLSRTRTSWLPLARGYRPDIPQADVLETRLSRYFTRGWRRHFASRLRGLGLEIAPLHRPLKAHAGMKVEYADIHTVAELRALYPELHDHPLAEPDILTDAQTLANVPDGRYDFVAAAHVMEHMRNPILAVENWLRVLKPGGLLYLVVPDKRETFDRRRVRTTLGHMVLDYLRPSRERDLEHYLEFAHYVRHVGVDDLVAEAERLESTGYSVHYHVFMPSDVLALVDWVCAHIRPVEVVEGPCMAPGSDEFHLLIRATPLPPPACGTR